MGRYTHISATHNIITPAIVFGVIEGKAQKGKPCREWTDDITDWCKEDLHTLRWKATDRAEWQRVVRHAINTNG